MTIDAGSRLGPYEIVARIGAGGMGEVFEARDTRLGRRVAIKVLSSDAAGTDLLLRLQREAKVIAGLNHPHICALYDVGSENDESYLIMELIEGETLANRMARGPLPLAHVLRFGAQLASALDRAHRAGIIHRDVKPSNVIVTRDGVKLLDFGLAKRSEPIPADSDDRTLDPSITERGLAVGTLLYMAPEQLRAQPCDARTDIFALGIVLYEMTTGKHPFEGFTRATIAAAILEHDPPLLRAHQPLAPPALEHIVRRCLAKEPDDRWQSAHDIADELQWISDHRETAAPPAATGRSKRAIGWIGAGLLAAALIGAAVKWPFFRSGGDRAPLVADLAPPPGTRFNAVGNEAGPVAVSPDGKFVVYSAMEGMVARLWLRSVVSGEVRRIDGTEGAAFPFWSPDSRSIAFFTLRELKRVDIGGGAPVLICAATAGRGGSWAPDGTIVFAPTQVDGLSRVAAAGGTPVPVTTLDRSQHTTHRWPFFLPDGKHFLFLAGNFQDPAGSANGIYLASVDGGAPRLLLRSNGNAMYVDGRLLFQRDETLYVQRLGRDFALEGEAVPIVRRVLYNSGVWHGAFSVSANGLLVYQSGRGALTSNLQWIDRRGVAGATLGEPAVYREVRLSRDQRRLAFVVGDPQKELFIHDLQRNLRTRIPNTVGVETPCWSADESTVFVGMWRNGQYELLAVKPDGGQTRLAGGERFRPLSILPGGKALVAASWTRVVRIPLDPPGTPVSLALPLPFYFDGQVSPNGKWFAYAANENGRREVFIVAVADQSRKWQVSTAGGAFPRWRGDSGEIFYVDPANRFVSRAIAEGKDALDIAPPQVLFTANLRPEAGTYDVAANGQSFLVNTLTEQEPTKAIIVKNWQGLP